MKKGFTITSRLNDQSKTDRMKAREAYEVEYLPLENIVAAKDNPYRMCDIEGLAASIEAVGLLTPITVKQPDAAGRYEIISGHRRVAACRLLLAEGHAAVAILPALIAREGGDAYSRLQLLHANSTARELTPAEKVMQVSEIKAALVEMKAENHPSLAGKRVRERLAELLEVSLAQVGILEQIGKNLAPGLKDAFQAGDMGMVQARNLSKLPVQEQEAALAAYRVKGRAALREAAKKSKQAEETGAQEKLRQAPALPGAQPQTQTQAAHALEAPTNAGLIRRMRDEELAAVLTCPNETGMADIPCDHCDARDCHQCICDWLKEAVPREEA